MTSNLLPCPFCGSQNVDPEGWASTERRGPACDDCGSSADTVAEWNTRPAEERLRLAFDTAYGALLCIGGTDSNWSEYARGVADEASSIVLSHIKGANPNG